jgi:serine protease Do
MKRKQNFTSLFSPGVLALALLLPLLWSSPALADRASRVTAIVKVVQEVGPAVVNIATKSRQTRRLFSTGDDMMDYFFKDFFQPIERERSSLGSGLIIDGKRGLIATNSHVISRATEITVQLADKRTFKAKVVGADPDSDLAVLRIRSQGRLPQVRMAKNNDLMIGEDVIAIGNPYGLSHTVTRGVISALNRTVPVSKNQYMHGLIQTDASINPGNSGGPLLNADGEVVGINTAIYQKAQGIGFTIPIAKVKRVVKDLVSHGEVIPAWLGLELQDLNPRLASYFGLDHPKGAIVRAVMKDSPAQKAGFKRGELILKINGRTLEDSSHYLALLQDISPGQGVSISIKAKKGEMQRRLKAKAFPMERAMEVAWFKLGVVVDEIDREAAARHRVRLNSGVMITRLRQNSRAERIGLRPGDLIRQVGEKRVRNLKQFTKQMARSRLMDRVTVLVQRGRIQQFVVLGR